MPAFTKVCLASDVASGDMKIYEVAGFTHDILVANVEGVIHATADRCPHEGLSFTDGTLEENMLTCSAHGYEFDIVTGQCTHEKKLCVFRYKVEIQGGWVCIGLF